MFDIKEKIQLSNNPMLFVLCRFITMLMLSLGITLLVQQSWAKNLNLYHTILEAACVFIALAIFVCIWYTYDKSDFASNILGFGYLIVAIFDAFHAYYHLKLNLTAISYFDLSTRFWMLGRLTEAITMLLIVSSFNIFTSKYKNIIISLGIALGLSYFVVGHHDLLPMLLTAKGVTPIKIFLEYVVIAIYLISFWKIKNRMLEKNKLTFEYIGIALLLSISAEFCFTIYITISNISWTLGHILKIASYYYLFKGTFISTVIFPYKELEDKNNKLETINKEMKCVSDTMKDVLDALPVAIQKYDKENRLKYTNKRFEELLQCERREIANATMQEMANTFIDACVNDEIIKDHLDKYNAITRIEKIKNSNGENLRLSLKTQKIRNGTLVMVTDTKKEQELQNLNIQTETILSAINNGVLMIDQNKKIVLANRALEDIYEVDKNQLLGMDIDHLNTLTHFTAIHLPNKVLSGNTSEQLLDITLTSFKGNEKELNLFVSPIKDIYGEIIGAISVVTDITEYKKEQQKLIQQEKLALMGQMGAGIVHETRNFLTTIKGRCQLIDMATNDENIRKHSHKINQDVEEVNRIISEFLFLSKPRETELTEISIFDLFQSIKGMVETSSLVRGVNLEVRMCDEDRYMLCDESQLKQVILNICKNGIDAMHDMRDAKLIVETEFNEEANELYIRIKDNGKGIDKENLEKIGTPFFTTKTTGTGLGLSVCYKIIKEHGGRIDVESEVGKGTTFTIVLPCIEDEDMEEVI